LKKPKLSKREKLSIAVFELSPKVWELAACFAINAANPKAAAAIKGTILCAVLKPAFATFAA